MQGHAVVLTEGDVLFQTFFLDLAAGLVKHLLRQVDAQYFAWIQRTVQLQGEVARSCRYVQYGMRLEAFEPLHSEPPPPDVDTQGHSAVHEIIGRRDAVKHLPDLLGLGRLMGAERGHLLDAVALVSTHACSVCSSNRL